MGDRGSEWRCWDLHVHTPESALANHYADWPSYIIPNIEFRTHPETGKGKAINLHILVDPEAPDAIAEIEQALGLLTFRYNDIEYPCSTESLRRLGRAVDGTQRDPWGAFKVGVNAFKPDFAEVRRWLENQGRWIRRNGIVVVANGKDGPSGLSKDAGFAAAREELYRCADMVFSELVNL